jgi:hypothetical protein
MTVRVGSLDTFARIAEFSAGIFGGNPTKVIRAGEKTKLT